MLTRLFFRGARVLHVSSGLRNPVANDVGDRPTLGSDSGSRNWAVGRKSGHLVRQLGLGLRRSRRNPGRALCLRETDYPVLAQLRSPAGASSLATVGVVLRILRTPGFRSSCRACEAAFGSGRVRT